MIIGLFLILKISAVKEYIFLGFILLIVGMFYEIYKGYQTRKNKKQRRKGCLRDH
jgi:predicted membrane protein